MRIRGKGAFVLALASTMVLSLLVSACSTGEKASQVQRVVVEKAVQARLHQASVVAGKISGEKEVNVFAKVTGRVAQVYGEIGQQVKAGDPLVVLEDGDYKAVLAQTAASLKGAQARLTRAQNYQLPQERIQVEEKVRAAQAKVENTRQNYLRTQALYESGAVPKAQLDLAEVSLIQDEAAYQQLLQDQKLTGEEPTREKIQDLQSTVEQIQAQMEKAQLDLSSTVITAPVSGKIAVKHIHAGEMASPSTAMMTLVSSQPIVEVNVPEEYINLLKVDQKLKTRIEQLSLEVDGVVAGISPLANAASKEYLVKLQLPAELPGWKSGLYVEVLLPTQDDQPIVVSKDAIVKRNLERMVMVTDGSKAFAKKVVTGRSDGTHIEIVSGLQAGDIVIVVGQNQLEEGEPVQIVAERGGNQ